MPNGIQDFFPAHLVSGVSHESVEFFPVRDINPEPSAMPGRQWWQSILPAIDRCTRGEDAPEPGLYQSRHSSAALYRFLP